MLIAIDHGNRLMKSSHLCFTSGLYESDTKPPFGEEILRYNGKYYSLSEKRIPYLRDKSSDERFFILSLFAISGELEAVVPPSPSVVQTVELAIGLPPSHYGTLYKKFEAYFKNRGVFNYEHNGRPYSIRIDDAVCFPQAVAAAMTEYNRIRQYSRCLVIDLGGYTVDFLMIQDRKPDFSASDSLEHGVILLYNDIIKKVNADLDILIEESDVDAVIQGRSDLPEQMKAIVQSKASAFADELAGMLRERGIDLRVTKTVFAGGGSALLRPYFESSSKINAPVFITDIKANVRGMS